MIIEVKDWNLDSYELEDEWTWHLKFNDSRLKSPIAQVKYYKDLFYNTYSRTLAEENLHDKNMYSLIQTAVFFYGSTESQVKKFFGKNLNDAGNILSYKYVLLLIREHIERFGFSKIPQANFFLGYRISTFFKNDIYEELYRMLRPSDHSLSKIFFPEKLSKDQQRLAQSVAGSRQQVKRQLRAPAGSGKTTVLVFRAVDAYRKTNKPVLILTYNITLCNYIRDCLSQALNSLPNIEGRKSFIMKNFFKIRHFHGFIKDYRAKENQLDIITTDENSKNIDTYKLTAIPQKFQTIFVDETQDFHRAWMETIVSLLEPAGELIFFGDWDQDLYEVRQMANVPVQGRPFKLNGTYRLHSKILELAQNFQIKFLPNSDNDLELPPKSEGLFGEYASEVTTISYHYFDALNVNAIVEIFESALKEYAPPNDDICILSQVIWNVRPVDKILRDKGYKTITTFEKEEDWQKYHNTDKRNIESIRQSAKHGFQMESGKIKLATIQSYKGWGIHTEILIIGNDYFSDDKKKFLNAEMVYTGITRAKKNLVIINIGEKQYDEFFQKEINNFPAKPQLTDAEKISLAKQKFDEAFKFYERGDYSGAIKLYTEVIELNPNHSNTYNNRGIAYRHSSDYQQAIRDFDKAIELNPNNTLAYNNRGIAYKNLKQYERAITDFQKYIELKPNDAAKAYKMLGECYTALADKHNFKV